MSAHVDHRGIFPTLCALSLLCACNNGPVVIVGVGPIPENAAQLRASVTYDGRNAVNPSTIVLDLHSEIVGGTSTFGVRLPAHTNAEIIVGVGVIDEAQCLIALGTAAADSIVETPRLDIALQPPPADVSRDDLCKEPEKTPLLYQVLPALGPTSGGTRIRIRGWGFQPSPCPLVNIAGKPATDVVCNSLSEIDATTPASLGTLGKVPITVINKSQRLSTRNDLFSYFASELRFDSAMTTYQVGAQPSSLEVGRIDGDNLADLVVSNSKDGTVTVRVNDGLGAFPDLRATTVPVGVRPAGVAIGDFNKDGYGDLAVANSGDNTVSLLLQGSAAVPSVFTARPPAFVNLAPAAVRILDLENDGVPELLVAHRVSGDVSVLQGSIMSRFSRHAEYSVGREPAQLVAGDLNGDGALDLAVANTGSGSVSILIFDRGSGGYLGTDELSVGASVMSVALGDVDGDGDVDVMTAGDKVRLLLNDGMGHFAQAMSVAGDVRGPLSALALGDLDRDSYPDLVVAAIAENRTYVLRNTSHDGAISFGAATGYPVGARPVALGLADFNGDGLSDLAVLNQGDGTVSIRFNRSM